MSVVSFKCPACGAPLTFDPETGAYTCDYCETIYSQAQLEELERQQVKQDTPQQDMAVYVCPSCGAQILTSTTTAATYCYYCHNAVIMSPRLTGSWEPDFIIPFAFDKQEAVNRFFSWIKPKIFVPRDFFCKEQIEKLTGVYFPYWLAEYHAHVEFTGDGTRVSTMPMPDYDIVTTRKFDIERKARMSFRNMIRPALSSANRLLDAGIHPFDLTKAVPFSMGYLSGFQAERRDVESAAFDSELTEAVKAYCQDRLTRELYSFTTHRGITDINIQDKNYRYYLLPCWILTYKGKDGKTYYYALNGQTGKVYGDLPVDKKKIRRYCLAVAAAVTVILMLGGWLIW